MKKLFVLLVSVTVMAVFPLSAFAQNNGGDEYEAIDLNFEQNNSNIGVRTGVSLPIEAYYCSGLSAVFVSFLDTFGDIDIRLTNLTTGYMISTVVDSSVGSYILPVTGGTGLYKLSFITEDGSHYSGFFNVL